MNRSYNQTLERVKANMLNTTTQPISLNGIPAVKIISTDTSQPLIAATIVPYRDKALVIYRQEHTSQDPNMSAFLDSLSIDAQATQNTTSPPATFDECLLRTGSTIIEQKPLACVSSNGDLFTDTR
jgi:hypothetical protein